MLIKGDKNSIELAVDLLQKGEIIVIPTETVYGLAGELQIVWLLKKFIERKIVPLIIH